MKNVVIFSDSMVKGLKMKQFNSHIHDVTVYVKAFPGAKADQLNHQAKTSLEEYKYDATIIHAGKNDILRSKGENEVNDIPRIKVMNIADTCRNYNIAKIFLSSIIRCSRTTVDIDYVNEKLENYVSKTIMNLLVICKLISVMEEMERWNTPSNLVRF